VARPRARFAPSLALAAAAAFLPACASPTGGAPPDWGWFDVTARPVGAIPATAGWALGHLAWWPVAVLADTVLPEPLAYAPGDALGLGCGFALGAPFHLLAAPLGDAGNDAAPDSGDGGGGR
jgi:hypothetical protein